ncbi:MAG: 4Fe-4S binding protein [Betaproteobacteria bacterium]|nr:4Fe-4S binding protein [Betaproteobacteria bacterium]
MASHHAGTGSNGSGHGAVPSKISSSSDSFGWTRAVAGTGTAIDAKIAALAAMNALAPFEPVAGVDYVSQGRLLIIADSARVEAAVNSLAEQLSMAVLWTSAAPAPKIDGVEVSAAKLIALRGYLGAFELGFSPAGAPQDSLPKSASFDLVLDLCKVPAFTMPQPPQGYFHAADEISLAKAMAELPDMVGEFEKPKFFAYKESLCAHSRSKKEGCNQCIEVCSTAAISADGDKVRVDPHLCMGCGACATVCPSGAMTYQYPRVADRGSQLKALLNAYRIASKGQGDAPMVLLHNATDGRDALSGLLAKGAAGIPASMLPVETWHVASTGLDVLLGAIAYGAGHVAILAAGSEAPAYRKALLAEMEVGQSILSQLGFEGKHFSLIESAEQLASVKPAATVATPAGFNLSNDKRATIEFAVEHLLRHAPQKKDVIDLPAGSLFGAVAVDKEKCTLCLACAGACPSSALMDGADYPRLKFLERNCVQCGLCENTCPENAISLTPRLLLTEQRKREVVLNESEPFDCISCGKPLGTKLMIDTMLGKLAGHSMFQGEGQLKRLQMCADCRVVDMMSNKHEVSILTGRPLE